MAKVCIFLKIPASSNTPFFLYDDRFYIYSSPPAFFALNFLDTAQLHPTAHDNAGQIWYKEGIRAACVELHDQWKYWCGLTRKLFASASNSYTMRVSYTQGKKTRGGNSYAGLQNSSQSKPTLHSVA